MRPSCFNKPSQANYKIVLKFSALSVVIATLSGCGENAKDCGGRWDNIFGREECAVPQPTSQNVSKTSQTISNLALPNPFTVGQSHTLAATSSSGLAVSYSSKTADICSITDAQVKALKVGVCTVEASQAGDDKTLAAEVVSVSKIIQPVCAENEHVNEEYNICFANTTTLSPSVAIVDTKTTFSLTGQKLPTVFVAQLSDCSGLTVESKTIQEIRLSCTPTKTGSQIFKLTHNDEVLNEHYILVMDKASSNLNVKLPAMPSEPKATIIGVDSNKNGVRDEVEHALRLQIAHDGMYLESLKLAKEYQSIISNPPPKTREEALQIASNVACTPVVSVLSQDGDLTWQLTFDTLERQQKFDAYNSELAGGFLGAELKICGELVK